MQAPKNGFFYVLDRATGEFISGDAYATVTWAKGLDPKTGRPIENPDARHSTTGKPGVYLPGPGAGDAKGAIEQCEKAVALREDYREAWYNLGAACALARRHADAARAFCCVTAIDPGAVNAWINLERAHADGRSRRRHQGAAGGGASRAAPCAGAPPRRRAGGER